MASKQQDTAPVSKRIEDLMNTLGLTPRQFAEALGCPPSLVYTWIRGDSEPGYRYLSRMIEVFKITPERLFDRRPQ